MGHREDVTAGHLLRRLVDAAVGGGALAVDIEVVAMLLIVQLALEAQDQALVARTSLLVTLCLVELTWGVGGSTQMLGLWWSPE